MDTILVVEDEKLIRQGLKTMIQRSGVPVRVILECNNGQTALEILKEEKVDVMFTDIRMPKMDGIELVKQMQALPHVPLTVAVSGYEDFTYAVEMLRQGVREYILKPVEREKITEILQKLEKELQETKDKNRNIEQIGYRQLKHLMQSEEIGAEEIAELEKQYGEGFFPESFRVCCMNHGDFPETAEGMFFVRDVGLMQVLLAKEGVLEEIIKKDLSEAHYGISGLHSGFAQVRDGFEEACAMRKKAFCRTSNEVWDNQRIENIPESLLAEAEKYIDQSGCMQRVQLIGTEKKEELRKAWTGFFHETKGGRISPSDFERCMQDFFEEASRTYKSILEERGEEYAELREIWRYDSLAEYENAVIDFVLWMQEEIEKQFDVNKNRHKMMQAIQYVDENYASDLNMAVVSNYVSMNYSLFSYSFKQYTGKNFVDYVKEVRLREAKRLLAETDLRVNEICRQIGYDNEKHFMKLFKAECGVSAGEYRKNQQLGKF